MMNGSNGYPLRVQTDTAVRFPYVSPLAAPVRVSIAVHQNSEGKHRLRIGLSRDIAHELARGLSTPRIHIQGTVTAGFRIWCQDTGGYAPIPIRSGGWYVAVGIRRVNGRERAVGTEPVSYHWDRDHHGPVLVLDPLPENFRTTADEHRPRPTPRKPCPTTALSNAFAEAERKLAEAMDEQRREAAAEAASRPVLTLPAAIPEPEPIPAPAPAIVDLKEAIGLVNELLAEADGSVTLIVGEDGRLSAKRRLVSYVEL